MDSIQIQGYKSIKNAELQIKPINILIGANGAGKSNFLSFFDFLNSIYEQRLKEYVSLNGGVDRMLFRGREITNEISAHVKFGPNGYSFTIEPGAEHFIYISEGAWYKEHKWEIASNTERSTIKQFCSEEKGRGIFIKYFLDSFKKYHFHNTGKNSPFNQMSSVENDIYYLYERGENLAAFLYGMKHGHPKTYSRMLRTIQSIAPYISDFFLQPNSNHLMHLRWKDRFSNRIYGVNDLSDGTIRFIALTALFMQPELPSTLIIDEPELGLHPFAIVELAGMIKSASDRRIRNGLNRKCRVIVATQSPDLLNHFETEDIVTVDQREGATTFKRLDKKGLSHWLDEEGIGDLWQKYIIKGGQPE